LRFRLYTLTAMTTYAVPDAPTDSSLFRSRSLDCGGSDSVVYLDGTAQPGGGVEWLLYVLADDREPLTAAQAREFAGMILAAADELDGLR
jgi:hypothetical protein